MRVVLDIDGTLCHSRGANYEDPASLLANCQPIPGAHGAVMRHLEQGHEVSFLTGRPEKVRAVTRLQLASWFPLDEIEVRHRQHSPFSWELYVQEKATSLNDLAADLYIGDRSEDRQAAKLAGVAFLDAEEWRGAGAVFA